MLVSVLEGGGPAGVQVLASPRCLTGGSLWLSGMGFIEQVRFYTQVEDTLVEVQGRLLSPEK